MYMGTFDTALEGAVAYARYVQSFGSEAAAAEEEGEEEGEEAEEEGEEEAVARMRLRRPWAH